MRLPKYVMSQQNKHLTYLFEQLKKITKLQLFSIEMALSEEKIRSVYFKSTFWYPKFFQKPIKNNST